MCTSTDDCFCQEHVRQSLSPKRSYAARISSSALRLSESGIAWAALCGLLRTKQHLLQGVRTEAAAERLERDHLVRRDVAEVHLGAEVLYEPRLGGLLRCFEDEVAEGDAVHDLVDEPRPHLAARPVDARRPAFATLGDHLPGACGELLGDPLHPLVRGKDLVSVLRADLGKHREVLG